MVWTELFKKNIFILLFFIKAQSFALLNDELTTWDIPNTSTYAGNLFRHHINIKHELNRQIRRYEVYTSGFNSTIPSWLRFDDFNICLEGIPLEEDIGEYYITIKGYDINDNYIFKDVLFLEVVSGFPELNQTTNCTQYETRTLLYLILDVDVGRLSSIYRLNLVKQIAQVLNMTQGSIKLSRHTMKHEMLTDSIIVAGPGNMKGKHFQTYTNIGWQVGCNGVLWNLFTNSFEFVKLQSKNGRLSEILGYPILGWRLVNESEATIRRRRELDNPNDLETVDEVNVPGRIIPFDLATPNLEFQLSSTFVNPGTSESHRHRHDHKHHHKDPQILSSNSEEKLVITSLPDFGIYNFNNNSIDNIIESTSSKFVSSLSSVTLGTQETEITGDDDATIEPSENDYVTPPLSNLVTITYSSVDIRNVPPTLLNRVQKIAVTAGTTFRLSIPTNTFFDPEDGDTRNLTLSLTTVEGHSISNLSWIQFDPKNQEILTLPLEEHVSKWIFTLTASDMEGLTAQDNITIIVQQHRGTRTVTHAIMMAILSVPPGPPLNWQFLLVDSIYQTLHDRNSSNITVLSINDTSSPIIFSWTNDSLPRHKCPKEDINNIIQVLNYENELKENLKTFGIDLSKISFIGMGPCETRPPVPTSIDNNPPDVRNQIDHINITAGELLLFKVPHDTFFDNEDQSNLKLHLTHTNGKSIAPDNWLQFDEKNQEFYGVPLKSNIGAVTYHLICTDSGGLSAYDGLEVIVHPRQQIMYNVEFNMKLETDKYRFKSNTTARFNFIQKLAQIFGDSPSNIIIDLNNNTATNITSIIWYNKSLPIDICPYDEINRLRQIILTDEEKVTTHVEKIIGSEFQVLEASLTPLGICQGILTEVSTGIIIPGTVPSDVTAVSHNSQYLVGLVIPTVVITIMLICAGAVACILYRRRRSGKMSIGDEDERQSFRSKGIPVIFQDELDERPEPTNKSPVIMKEEKPPLPPPEYNRGTPLPTTALLSDTEDALYQPPPPFTGSKDAARPKPTPTYRMPPPYVPP